MSSGTRLAVSACGSNGIRNGRIMSFTGITNSALSTLLVNSAALGVVSDNVSNLNTPGYARRVVQEQTQSSGGQIDGVDIATIQRVADQFLNQEVLTAGGTSSQYDTENKIISQLNSLLGQPGGDSSLTTALSNVFTALGQAQLSPTASASQVGVTNAFASLASSISNLSGSISGLQNQVDQQVTTTVSSANALIQQIYNLNVQAKAAVAAGNTDTALLDQRDLAVQNLSQIIGIRSVPQGDGGVQIYTTDGVNLVGDNYAQLSYAGGATNGIYGNITLQNIKPQSGQPIGTAIALDPHLSGGALKGLIDMRDNTLASLGGELGQLAQATSNAFNQVSNANAAYPPPASLTGRDTGLLSTDALNFSGKSTFAVTDSSGNLVSRIDVDFGAGTISVDGGAATSFTATIGGFATALNSALGAGGSASFANGVLSVSATGTNGIVVQDDAATPSDRGGLGVSQFFGLNDLFQSAAPSTLATGLSASDSSGLAAGGTIALELKGPGGDIVKRASITTTAGQTVGDVVAALNTAMGGAATFTLNADGSITQSVSGNYSGYQIGVTSDTTTRGNTGISFTQLFGIGAGASATQAQDFSLRPAIAANPALLAFAKPQLTSTTVAGDTVVGPGDTSGLLALQNLDTAAQSFSQVGNLGAQFTSLSNYAGLLYQDVATRSTTITANQTAQDGRLQEAQTRQSSNSGVNLDEELSNMMTYQRAYSAGARMLTTVDALYQTLLGIQ
jgi:flagellar hook-associated protein 1 FlgK